MSQMGRLAEGEELSSNPLSGRVEEGRGDRVRQLRLPSPLVKPDVRISRIRLSDWLHRQAHGGGPK
jgi:hypothetical protein